MRLFSSKSHPVSISTWVQISSVWVDGRNATLRSSWADPWLKSFLIKPIILPILSDVMGFTFLLNSGSSHSVSLLSSLSLSSCVYLLDGWESSWYWIRRKLPGLTGGFESWDLRWSVYVAMGCQGVFHFSLYLLFPNSAFISMGRVDLNNDDMNYSGRKM